MQPQEAGGKSEELVNEFSTYFDNVVYLQTTQIERREKVKKTTKYLGVFFLSLFLIHAFSSFYMAQNAISDLGTISSLFIQESDATSMLNSMGLPTILIFAEIITVATFILIYKLNNNKIKKLDEELQERNQ